MNAKSIIKKIALALAGVAAITAVGFGVKAIVDYTKNDLKTISPSFSVGNLGADGKFVDDDSTLYTKEAFGCYGLQVKPDFDSSVNYQIFYYDILDNYISSTSILSEGFSDYAPLNGAYARIVIEPRDDEDGKISLMERIKYPSQLTVKVMKNQDIENRYTVFQGNIMQRVDIMTDLIFDNKVNLNRESLSWAYADTSAATSVTFLSVNGYKDLSVNFSSIYTEDMISYTVFQFGDLPSIDNYLGYLVGGFSNNEGVTFDTKTKYIIITVWKHENSNGWTETELTKLPLLFTLSK